MNKAKKKRCLNLERWRKAKAIIARKIKERIGKVIFRGKSKSADYARDLTLDHFGYLENCPMLFRSDSINEFFIPEQGWVRINFTEPYAQVSSPGLPTVTLPMAFEAVITALPAEDYK